MDTGGGLGTTIGDVWIGKVISVAVAVDAVARLDLPRVVGVLWFGVVAVVEVVLDADALVFGVDADLAVVGAEPEPCA